MLYEVITNKKQWEIAGIILPDFNVEKLIQHTSKFPEWVHFGGGNIFRVFIASALQNAIEDGRIESGIIVAESFDYEVIDRYYKKYDNLSLSVIMDADGNYHKKVIATVTEALKCQKNTQDCERLKEIVGSESRNNFV